MRRLLMLSTVFFLLAIFTQTGRADHKIATGGKALMMIVLPDKPEPVEKTAALELKEHLDLMTGASFKIISESDHRKNPQQAVFRLGLSPETRKMISEINPEKLGYDSIVIRTSGSDLLLNGHPKRGTLYAVYSFLEDLLGVHWWSDRERFIPNRPELTIPPQNIVYTPKLISREAHYRVGFDGVFAARLKQNNSSRTRMNGNRPVIAPEFGDNDHFIFYKGRGSILHSFFEILPPSVYFEKHPEWYSEINGARTAKHSQLCLTNVAMRKEFVKNALELLRADPTAKFISVTQNDWRRPCQCSECRAIDHENGDTCAGTMITFVNQVAEEIEKEFPEVFIETLAYQYTRQAPTKVRPRHNVVIRLCSIECGFLRPLEEDTRNASFVKDIRDWSKIADRLFIWNYVTTFHSYMIPHPNMRGLVPDLRFFVKNHAVGLFEQGDAFCLAGDFVRFRNWFLSRLMWNPNLDEKKLYDEFFHGYYGKEVGPLLQQYLKLIHDRAQKVDLNLKCFFTNVPEWLDLETYNQAVNIFNQAQAAATRLEKEYPDKYIGLTHKVKRERIPIDHIGLLYWQHWQKEAKKQKTTAAVPSDPVRAARELVEFWKELNVETWREFTTLHQFNQYCSSFIQNTNRQFEQWSETEKAK